MAEFCWDCTRDKLGIEPERNELSNLIEPPYTTSALCEGCGFIQVDHKGKRLGEPLPDPDEESS